MFFVGGCAVEPVEAHHADDSNASSGAQCCPGEKHSPGLIGGDQGPGLSVGYRDEMLSMPLEFIRLQVLPSSTVQSLVITPILGMAIRCHSPDGILKTHGRSHMRRPVKSSQIPVLVNNGQK